LSMSSLSNFLNCFFGVPRALSRPTASGGQRRRADEVSPAAFAQEFEIRQAFTETKRPHGIYRQDALVMSGSTERRVEPISKSAERPYAEPLVTS
jgi:hypothetical protein